jgi:hypothetical protein
MHGIIAAAFIFATAGTVQAATTTEGKSAAPAPTVANDGQMAATKPLKCAVLDGPCAGKNEAPFIAVPLRRR